MDFKLKSPEFSASDTLALKARIIDKWTPVSEVWALKFGDGILASLSTFGSMYITHFLRKELKIRPFAPVTCYAPVIGVSALSVNLFHIAVISKDIINRNTCPICVIVKGGIGQILSLGYSLIAAPVVCVYVADRLLTYPVPPLLRAPKEVFVLYHRILKKYVRPLSFISVFYMISACFITSQKYQNFKNIDLEARL